MTATSRLQKPLRHGPAVVTPTRLPGVRAAMARWADTLRQLLPRSARSA